MNGQYKTLKNPHTVMIHPSSLLFKDNPEYIIFHELVFTSKEYVRQVCEVESEWLIEIAPHLYSNKDMLSVKRK